MLRVPLIAMWVLLLAGPGASAEDACGCKDEAWTSGCEASVRQDGRWIFVVSDTRRCSRVAWLANDAPQVTLVSGGENIHEWLGQADKLTIAVQSCQVCKSEKDVKGGSASGSQDDADGGRAKKEKKRYSAFSGTWIAEGADVFGGPVPFELFLEVSGKEITGTASAGFFDGDQGKAAVSGIVHSMDTAVITIHARNWGRTRLKLLDQRTMELDSGLNSVELRKQ